MTKNTAQTQRTKLSEKYPLDDKLWRTAVANQARRERHQLIRKGVIVPVYAMRPSPIVKTTTGWRVEGVYDI